MAELLMCRDERPSALRDPRSLTCALPVRTVAEAKTFLETVGSGGALGSGHRLNALGVDMPRIRAEYDRRVAELVAEVQRRRALKQPAREIAECVVKERRNIANEMRWRSGVGTRVLFEVRDWTEYGAGGRTFPNVEARYAGRSAPGADIHAQMIRGATHANTGISDAAVRGARYLKYGGRVVIVFSLATTAYTLLTADPQELERLIYEQTGAFVGGSAAASLSTGACLVFGIATAGWGLLACGLVGGIVGGLVGSHAGSRIYYARSPHFETLVNLSSIIDASSLASEPPLNMCVGP